MKVLENSCILTNQPGELLGSEAMGMRIACGNLPPVLLPIVERLVIWKTYLYPVQPSKEQAHSHPHRGTTGGERLEGTPPLRFACSRGGNLKCKGSVSLMPFSRKKSYEQVTEKLSAREKRQQISDLFSIQAVVVYYISLTLNNNSF